MSLRRELCVQLIQVTQTLVIRPRAALTCCVAVSSWHSVNHVTQERASQIYHQLQKVSSHA